MDHILHQVSVGFWAIGGPVINLLQPESLISEGSEALARGREPGAEKMDMGLGVPVRELMHLG